MPNTTREQLTEQVRHLERENELLRKGLDDSKIQVEAYKEMLKDRYTTKEWGDKMYDDRRRAEKALADD